MEDGGGGRREVDDGEWGGRGVERCECGRGVGC